jgi:hypothetical protein
MWGNASKRRPKTFQPTVDGQLESRFLLSRSAVPHAAAVHAAALAAPSGQVIIQNANGGRAVIIHNAVGAEFEITLTNTLQPTAPPQITAGTLVVTRGPNDSFNITAIGTTVDSELTINPLIKRAKKHKAHDFATGALGNNQLLNINSINVVSGQINSIEGYHSAVLQGPIVVGGNQPVNRIAFAAIQGGSIIVNGDLDTLDVLGPVDLTGGLGIFVGRDLNWFDTISDFTIGGNARFVIGRDLGLIAQPAKGTGPAGQGGFVNGNFTIEPGSIFTVGRAIDAPIIVNGNLVGASHVQPPVLLGGFLVRGNVIP